MRFEDRTDNIIKKRIAETIYKNEKGIFAKISDEIKKNGSYDGPRCIKLGNISYITSPTGNAISFWSAGIEQNKEEGRICYYINSEELGLIVLADVSKNYVSFPIHGTEVTIDDSGRNKLKEVGELPLEFAKDTVRETIENSVRNHPILGKYADMILGDFNTILSYDTEREIIPLSEEAKIIVAQKREIESLKKENLQQKSFIEQLMGKIKGIPFFGKRMLKDLSEKLPPAQGEQTTTEPATDRKKFAESIQRDVTGIDGIRTNGNDGKVAKREEEQK